MTHTADINVLSVFHSVLVASMGMGIRLGTFELELLRVRK